MVDIKKVETLKLNTRRRLISTWNWEAIERIDDRTPLSMKEKWQQLQSLWAMGKSLGFVKAQRDDDQRPVWDVWLRIRKYYEKPIRST